MLLLVQKEIKVTISTAKVLPSKHTSLRQKPIERWQTISVCKYFCVKCGSGYGVKLEKTLNCKQLKLYILNVWTYKTKSQCKQTKKKDEFSMNIINALNKQILIHLFTLTCTLKNTGLFLLRNRCVEPVGYSMLCFFFPVLGGFCVTQLLG